MHDLLLDKLLLVRLLEWGEVSQSISPSETLRKLPRTALVSPEWLLPLSNGCKFMPCLTANTTKHVKALKYVQPMSLSLRDHWDDIGATGIAGATQMCYWLLSMAVPRGLCEGCMLSHRVEVGPVVSSSAKDNFSHSLWQCSFLPPQLQIFSPSECAGAARSLGDGRPSPRYCSCQAMRGVCVPGKLSILGWGIPGSPHIICPLSLYIIPRKKTRKKWKLFFPICFFKCRHHVTQSRSSGRCAGNTGVHSKVSRGSQSSETEALPPQSRGGG